MTTSNSRRTARRRLPVMALILCLPILTGGCGTNVPALLESESRLQWQAEETLATAELQGRGWEEPYTHAEAAKAERCEPLYDGVMQRVDAAYSDDGLSFGDHFWADLQLVGALVLPIRSVEDCAAAHRELEAEHGSLQARLTEQALRDSQ